MQINGRRIQKTFNALLIKMLDINVKLKVFKKSFFKVKFITALFIFDSNLNLSTNTAIKICLF